METAQGKSLAGRTILIAPARQHEIAKLLEGLGARVLQCSAVTIHELPDYSALDEVIENLFGYDWILFANVHAADHFLRRLLVMGKDAGELEKLRVLALGEATARTLSDSQVHVDLISNRLKAADTLSMLQAYAGGADSLRGQNFLIPRGSDQTNRLSAAIEEAGARVDVVAAYRTALAEPLEYARINALLSGGGIDWVVFPDSSSVHELAGLLDANDLSEVLQTTFVACSDQSTADCAREFGLSSHVVNLLGSPDSVAEAFAEIFVSSPTP